MLILLRGTTVGMTNGRTLFDLPPESFYLGSGTWFGVPTSIWIAGFLYIVFGVILRYHRLGRALYAIGGNLEAARIAGIPVERITRGVHALAGLLAALAGLMLTGRIALPPSSRAKVRT
jgi:simple sugar transport system permease protein